MDKKEISPIKIIASASEMSNLVGMYAFLLEGDKIQARVFIRGKADNTYFICQIISPFDGKGNIAKLLTLEELSKWVIIPNQDLANEIMKDYESNGWRYGIHF
jgi:hypothetical protein